MFNLYDCHTTWNAFYKANLFTSLNRNKYSQEFHFTVLSPHIISTQIDCEHVLSSANTCPPPKGSFVVYPLMTLAFVFVILCVMYKSVEGHWCPWKAWAPSAFIQPLSPLLQFSGCCINTQVIGRLENVMSVATPADGKTKSISMDCIFRHTHKPATVNELHWFSGAVFRGLVCDFIHC